MQPNPLAQPLGHLMRPTFTVDLQDSLEIAARKLRENGAPILPVTDGMELAGGITEPILAAALATGLEASDPVQGITAGVLTARPTDTGAEALRLFEFNGFPALVVIDDGGRVLGIVTPSDLFPKKIVPPRPSVVGGMATPFGVHLTTGSIRAGVSHFALISTGMLMFGLFLIASILTTLLVGFLASRGVDSRFADIIEGGLPFLLFLGGMRVIPLSGIHAAEHKVVHAIERGEELVPSVIRRMPRVHPRCGTNFAVGATLFMSLANATFIASSELRFLLAAVVTLAFWKPLGSAMQYYVTTKKPSEKQIEMGIRSGKELLQKFADTGGAGASIWVRLFNSGMFHVIAGSFIMYLIVALIVLLLGLPIEMI